MARISMPRASSSKSVKVGQQLNQTGRNAKTVISTKTNRSGTKTKTVVQNKLNKRQFDSDAVKIERIRSATKLGVAGEAAGTVSSTAATGLGTLYQGGMQQDATGPGREQASDNNKPKDEQDKPSWEDIINGLG